MEWTEFETGARQTSWVAYLATADRTGRPHVAPVAPGFSDGTLWVATRRSSTKFRNLTENTSVALHWPVTGGAGPGEIFARGTARLWSTEADRIRLWAEAPMPYDLSQFFGTPDNADLAFVEISVSDASILGPDIQRRRWRR